MNKDTRIGWIIIGIISLLVLVCAGGFALVMVNASDILDWGMRQSSLKVGSPAPDFELTSLDGKTISLGALQGKPVLLSFGASWCPGCREEAPLLQELHESHPGMVVLLVDMEEKWDVVQDYAQSMGLSLPVLPDRDGKVSRQYHIYAIPASFFIDRDGVLRSILIEVATPQILAENLPLIGVEP